MIHHANVSWRFPLCKNYRLLWGKTMIRLHMRSGEKQYARKVGTNNEQKHMPAQSRAGTEHGEGNALCRNFVCNVRKVKRTPA